MMEGQVHSWCLLAGVAEKRLSPEALLGSLLENIYWSGLVSP